MTYNAPNPLCTSAQGAIKNKEDNEQLWKLQYNYKINNE